MKIGVVGLGYVGLPLAVAFCARERVRSRSTGDAWCARRRTSCVCDDRRGRRPRLLGPEPRPQLRPAPGRRARLAVRLLGGGARALGRTFPSARTTTGSRTCSSDDSLDAVVVATPVPTPRRARQRALEAGKHCFVEKPLAPVRGGGRGGGRGRAGGGPRADGRPSARVPPGRRAARPSSCGSGELGDLRYIYSNRLNLGKHRAGRERALVAGRARRVGDPAARRRGAVRVRRDGRELHAAGRRGRGVRAACASTPA